MADDDKVDISEADRVVWQGPDGQSETLVVLAELDVNGHDVLALAPEEQVSEEAERGDDVEIYFAAVIEHGEDEAAELSPIEDGPMFDAAVQAFQLIFGPTETD